MQDEHQEVGHRSEVPPEEQEPTQEPVAVTTYQQQGHTPPARSVRASAPPSFTDLQSFVAELATPEALERSKALAAAYDQACQALIGENDVQKEGGREFKKKSAWRKLGRHFFITVDPLREPHGRWEQLPHDDAPHFVASAEVMATAPWGQQMPGFGACSTRELRFYTKGPKCPACGGPMWDNRNDGRGSEHFACRDKRSCGGVLMEGQYEQEDLGLIPNAVARAKAEHDCLATAQTRAMNRAISELIAMGEVTWEEVDQGALAREEDARPQGGGGQRPRSQQRTVEANLDAEIPFGKHQGKTWRWLCEEQPGSAWWHVRTAERTPQPVKDMLQAELERLAEVKAQEEATRAEQEADPSVSALDTQVPGGKYQGTSWRQALKSDPAYFKRMANHAFGQEHYPEGTELRAAVDCMAAEEPLEDQHVVPRWVEAATGDGTLLDGLAQMHPDLPDTVAEWSTHHWHVVATTGRKPGWARVKARVEQARAERERQAPEQEGKQEEEHGPEHREMPRANPEPPAIPKRLRGQVPSALAMAARHQLPPEKVKAWREELEAMLEAGNAKALEEGLAELQQAIYDHIGHGRSPVASGPAAQEEAQAAMDFGGASHE